MTAPFWDRPDQYPIPVDQLPPSWSVARVGEVMEDVRSGFASGVHNDEGRGVPHLRPMNVDVSGQVRLDELRYVDAGIDDRRLAPGDVLFNNTNSPALVGKTAPVLDPRDWAFSNHMTRLRPRQGVLTRFVAHQLHFLWMSGYFRAICINHVNQASVSGRKLAESVPLVLPDAHEQQRIVDAIEANLSRLDAGVASMNRVQHQLRRMTAAILRAAVEGRLSSKHPNGGPAAPTPSPRGQSAGEPGSLPPIPDHWSIATLENLTDPDRPIRYGILMPKDNDPSGVLYVKVKNISPAGVIDLPGLSRTSPEIEARYARSRLRADDILVTIRGTYGRVAVVPPELAGGNITQDTARVALLPKVDGGYLVLFLRSPFAQSHFRKVARGVAVKGVNIGDLRALPVALPPLPEQQRITQAAETVLSITRHLQAEAERGLRRSSTLRQSILAAAFSGRLVPPDSTATVASEVGA